MEHIRQQCKLQQGCGASLARDKMTNKGKLTTSTTSQARDSLLHAINPVSIGAQLHQLVGGGAQRAQRCKQVDDHAGVVAHGAQHVGSAQHIVHRPQMVAKERTDDEDDRSCGAQVLQQEVLYATTHTSCMVCQ